MDSHHQERKKIQSLDKLAHQKEKTKQKNEIQMK